MENLSTTMGPHLALVSLFCSVISTLSLLLILGFMIKFFQQAKQTLIAHESFVKRASIDLPPVLFEVRELLRDIKNFETSAQYRVASMAEKVEDVTASISKAAEDAKHKGSAVSAGILHGIETFLHVNEERS